MGLLAGLGLRIKHPIIGWVLFASLSLLSIMTFLNLRFGMTVKRIHKYVQNRFESKLLRKEAKNTGIDFGRPA